MKKRSKSIAGAANTLNNSDNNSLFEGNSRNESHHNGCTGGGSSGARAKSMPNNKGQTGSIKSRSNPPRNKSLNQKPKSGRTSMNGKRPSDGQSLNLNNLKNQ